MLSASWDVPQEPEPTAAFLMDGSELPDPALTLTIQLYHKGKFQT